MSEAPVVTEVDGHVLQLTNLDKVLFPDGTTKAELISYHLAMAETWLPHLKDRCITRLRFPHGTEADSFYEKNAPRGTPEWVRTIPVLAQDSIIDYVAAEDAATLVWLANLAAIEVHTPQWRSTDAPETQRDPIDLEGEEAVLASTLVVDLDPGPGVTMHQICQAAMLTATELAGQGLVPFVKTSGSKGIQLMASIEPTPWRTVVQEMQGLGKLLERRHKDIFTTTMAKQARTNLIYFDALQNRGDRNTITVYSCRGREQPRVSTPVTWDEIAAVGPDDTLVFTIDQVPGRVAELGDLWAPLVGDELASPLPRWASGPTA